MFLVPLALCHQNIVCLELLDTQVVLPNTILQHFSLQWKGGFYRPHTVSKGEK